MPFFEPAGESDDSFGKKGPPPIAKKPKAPGGYDSEEDRYLRHSGEVNIANIRLTVKPVLSSHSKIDKPKVLMTNGSLMKVESIAECSSWSILQYF